MNQRTVSVPTIGDRPEDFDRLFGLWQQVNGDCLDVRFNFSGCRFIRHNGVAFIGGLARLIQNRAGKCFFDLATLGKNARDNLERIGFLDAFGSQTSHVIGHTIPYREDSKPDPDSIVAYLKTAWIGRGWVKVSPLLRDAIVGRMWEIYANAFEHGQSSIGVLTCGRHYPRHKELSLTVVDFGVGIPSNVRIFLQTPAMPAKQTLEWAFRRGTTTKANGVGCGLGLDLLKEFVRVNEGRLEVFSHEGYALIDKDQETYHNRDFFFEGTLLNITLRCDESYYRFASEAPPEPLF